LQTFLKVSGTPSRDAFPLKRCDFPATCNILIEEATMDDASTETSSVAYTSALDRTISFFYELAGDNKGLAGRLSVADRTPGAWVEIASSAGFEFNEDDLREIAEELLQRPVGREASVRELVSDLLLVEQGRITLSAAALDRLKAVMQQGRFSGYYRPW
jgi:hypothetical protein